MSSFRPIKVVDNIPGRKHMFGLKISTGEVLVVVAVRTWEQVGIGFVWVTSDYSDTRP